MYCQRLCGKHYLVTPANTPSVTRLAAANAMPETAMAGPSPRQTSGGGAATEAGGGMVIQQEVLDVKVRATSP